MADFSFDVVSKVDLNIVEEAINIAKKEVSNRYDFKDANPTLELLAKENKLKLSCKDEYKVKALYDILLTRLSKRGIALKNFIPQKIESGLGGSAKQELKIDHISDCCRGVRKNAGGYEWKYIYNCTDEELNEYIIHNKQYYIKNKD